MSAFFDDFNLRAFHLCRNRLGIPDEAVIFLSGDEQDLLPEKIQLYKQKLRIQGAHEIFHPCKQSLLAQFDDLPQKDQP